ncbi:hypothetical protein COT12_00655 [Candidatus Berkelbacteria bacterium CG08_land_8_20_14_0_20_39_8]|uniref:Uncharacterized protein n=1 Tax=Candidatus Berkelbacteria bacterium CG08_land_8_20_14_0_20_39_8 TaxID=1974511 RepID=A0A2M6YCW3_9BACT|nr:MAG: hypothetical protein COT12_00655 [Candidatus Berkelbacteria bacterium CG08_land_8_20_14_0_20_39_8]
MLDSIFSFYDKTIMGLSPGYSGLISLAILLVLLWSFWHFIRGNFIWIILILIFIPAAWPAVKSIGRILLILGTFLILHI